MKRCQKCGNEINDDAKFCSKCGAQLNEIDDNEEYEDLDNDEYEDRNKKKNKIKIAVGIFIVIFIVIASAVGIIKYKEYTELNKRNIQVVNVNVTDYPNVKIQIKASNYPEKMKKDNLSVKENDVFPKDVELVSDDTENYTISYTSSEKDSDEDVNVKIASYTEDGKEVSAEISYKAPENNSTKDTKVYNGKANGDNSVNTYDDNEILVKNAVDRYERAYIQMINNKDTYYIKSAIDLSGGLLSEFEKTVSSYKDQEINETLRRYNVENITKLSGDKYDVTVYEQYHIYYGKEHEDKNEDFRTRYIVNKSGSEFKVYSIKNIDKI